MSQDINDSFVTQFESEVFAAYQRMGSKLANTVRRKMNVKGSTTTFQKVGKGAASQKSRHGNVPTMSIDHTPVSCTLTDYYAADYIDKLDELKIQHDERGVVTMSAAAALGRTSDSLILTAMDGTTNTDTDGGGTGHTITKIEDVFAYFGESDVPDDGMRFWATSPDGWVDLLSIAPFTNADYIGFEDLPYKGGMVAKRFLGFVFFMHSGLPTTGGKRQTFAWHTSAVGQASGLEVSTEINYVPEKVAHLANSMMSQGAVLIDATGCYEVQITE